MDTLEGQHREKKGELSESNNLEEYQEHISQESEDEHSSPFTETEKLEEALHDIEEDIASVENSSHISPEAFQETLAKLQDAKSQLEQELVRHNEAHFKQAVQDQLREELFLQFNKMINKNSTVFKSLIRAILRSADKSQAKSLEDFRGAFSLYLQKNPYEAAQILEENQEEVRVLISMEQSKEHNQSDTEGTDDDHIDEIDDFQYVTQENVDNDMSDITPRTLQDTLEAKLQERGTPLHEVHEYLRNMMYDFYDPEEKASLIKNQKVSEKQALANQLDSEPLKYLGSQESEEMQERTLPDLRETGLTMRINPDHIADFVETAQYYQEQEAYQGIPLVELMKNERILDLSGYENSKVALPNHDIFDHAVFTQMLIDQDIISPSFEQDIGNPQTTDILGRAGERYASLGFNLRKVLLHFSEINDYVGDEIQVTEENKYYLLQKLDTRIAQGVERYPDEEDAFEKARECIAKIIQEESHNDVQEEIDQSQEVRSIKVLEFIVNDLVSEFMNENIVKGPLKKTQVDSETGEVSVDTQGYFEVEKHDEGQDLHTYPYFQPTKNIEFFDPRYLAMMTQVAEMASQPETREQVRLWENTLSIYVENALQKSLEQAQEGASQGIQPQEFNINMEELENLQRVLEELNQCDTEEEKRQYVEEYNIAVSLEKIQWFQDHPGFTTQKNPVE